MDPGPQAGLSRREFVRRSAMAAVAAAASGGVVGWGHRAAGATLAGDTMLAGGSTLPPLAVAAPVAGVTAGGGRLVAVGGEPDDPRVWSWGPGAGSWGQEADRASFPAGTGLQAIGRSAGGFVAVGSVRSGGGPRPAIFRTVDARRWEQVETGILQRPGAFTAVAERGGRLLAAGCWFAEPDVGEPVGTIAVTSAGGDPWTAISLDGVRPTRHGAVTLLAATPEGLVLASSDVDGLELYLTPAVGQRWRRIGLPRLDPPAAIVAAGATGSRAALAAVDGLDRGRLWLGGSRGWREVSLPGTLPPSARVFGFAESAGSLVAAGEGATSSFVEEVAVA